jgi:hypothetical protein
MGGSGVTECMCDCLPNVGAICLVCHESALAAAEAERDRLAEALDYYACVDHYDGSNHQRPVVMDDKGAKARALLAGKEKAGD